MTAQAPSRKTVVIGLLGTTLDAGKNEQRWNRWRPTVDLFRQEDLLVHRLELLHDVRHTNLAEVVLADARTLSPESEARARIVPLEDPWDFERVYATLHDFARAYPFDVEREDYLVHVTTGSHVAQICLFLLVETRHFPARLIQTSPPRAGSGHTMPGKYSVIDLDLSRYDRIASRFRKEQVESLTFLKSGIETRNATFNRLIERIEQVAISSRAPLLLTGPTGAGKSRLARRIFELKKARRQVKGSFVELNCATLRGDAAMSALFGHVKGAFTGAIQERKGLLRAADQGILFLDEVGELGLDEQAMLLRALEEKVFLPVGADQEARSEFQLIAGTNRDLAEAVREGRFRDDLLARINLWSFRMPSLRERAEDLPANLEFELEEFARTTGQRVTFNAEARRVYLEYATSPEARWPGNFRDLNASVLRMSTLAAGGRIDRELVDEELGRLRSSCSSELPSGDAFVLERVLGQGAAAALDRFDAVQLAEVLRVCRDCRTLSDAGRTLFAASRARKRSANDADRLRKYLARFDLTLEDVRARLA